FRHAPPPRSTLFPYTTLFRSDDRVQSELAKGRVNSVHAGIVINRQRFVIRHAIGKLCRRKSRVHKVWIRIYGLCEIEDVLVEKWHFDIGVRVVEVNCSLEGPARHRNSDASCEIVCHIEFEVIEQDEELAIGGREGETRLVEINHGGSRCC